MGKFRKQVFLFSRIHNEKKAVFETRRRDWLNSIGLNLDPFHFNTSDTKFGTAMKENVEVCWNDLSPTIREQVEHIARKNNDIVLQNIAWVDVEAFIGFVAERNFPNDSSGYLKARKRWLQAINIRCVYPTPATLENLWNSKTLWHKETLIDIAQRATRVMNDEIAAERMEKPRLEAEAEKKVSEKQAALTLNRTIRRAGLVKPSIPSPAGSRKPSY